MSEIINKIRTDLFAMQDKKYKDFLSKSIPSVSPDSIIGVRTPLLKQMAKKLITDNSIDEFLQTLPHMYFEEYNLHGFIISQFRSYEQTIISLEKFLPFVDNWATCDQLQPRSFSKNTEDLIEKIKLWLNSSHTYTVRFALGMLMKYYLDDKTFSQEYLELATEVKSDEYYIKMMVSWYFATALAKQYDITIKYIEDKKLSDWVHNKTIQKAIESFRISAEHKEKLKTFKIIKS